jgi:AraC-like DNA-binding protein
VPTRRSSRSDADHPAPGTPRPTYRELPAPPGLAPHVACLWTREHNPDAPDTRVVPDGCVDLMWIADGTDGRIVVAGPDTRGHVTSLGPGGRIAGVRFAPGTGAGVLGLPLHALRDTQPDLADVWGDAAAGAAADAIAAADETQRPLAVAGVVAARFAAGRRPGPGATDERTGPDDPAMRHVAAVLGDADGRVSVHDLAWDLGMSERQLHRRCTVAFGYGPKLLHRVLRFQAALALARSGLDLARVAHECGYADQPHFARDVADLAGVPITTLLTA